MARQKLINFHSSGTTVTSLYTGDNALVLGEIAVQHNEEAPKLHIRVSDKTTGAITNTLASFIDSSAVDAKINSAVTIVNQTISNVDDKLGEGFDATNTVAKAIKAEEDARKLADSGLTTAIESVADDLANEVIARELTDTLLASETTARTSADSALDTKIVDVTSDVETIKDQLYGIPATSGAVASYVAQQIEELTDALDEIEVGATHDYVTVTIGNKTAERTQSVAVEVATVDVSAATATTDGLAVAYDVKGVTDALGTRINGVVGDIGTIQDQLDGFGTASGAVKTYVDNAISSAVTSVYKVKGSVATYDALTGLTGMVEGDVYNVESECTVDEKYYPAGTNWVWVAATTGETPVAAHWDPLGGTIDLSPYLTISAFETYSATTKTTLDTYGSDIDTLKTGLSTETTNRENGDKAINDKIGSGFDSENTISKAISDEIIRAEGAESTLDNKITAETQARETRDLQLTSSAETLTSSISNEVTRAEGAESALDNKITAETQARESADTALGVRIDNLSTGSTELRGLISAETEARISRDSELTTSAQTNTQGIATINENLGSGFSQSSTVADQLGEVKTTADSAVQTVDVANKVARGISVSKSGTTVTLNFDEMIIDCGYYGNE